MSHSFQRRHSSKKVGTNSLDGKSNESVNDVVNNYTRSTSLDSSAAQKSFDCGKPASEAKTDEISGNNMEKRQLIPNQAPRIQKFINFFGAPSQQGLQLWVDGTKTIDVRSCIVDIAYDFQDGSGRRRNIFRLTTQQQTEHLFQVEDPDDMLRWLEDLQQSSKTGEEEIDSSDSMALIIKRYEAKSQALSPGMKPKKSVKSGNFSAPILAVGGEFHCLESVQEQPRKDNATQVAVDTTPRKAGEDQVDSKGTGEATPNRVRKWRKVKKSGSCPSADQPKAGGTSKDPHKQPLFPSTPVFGQPLQHSPTSGEQNDFVPLFVQLCVKIVEAQGINAVGVYRIPGNTAAVNSLMASLDKGIQQVDFSDPRWKDVNVVSSLLKAYFRKLPEPILTDKYYPIFIDANRISDHAARLKKLKTLLHKLPKHNQETLKYLLHHLKKVASRCEFNKMEARNLALMFGPSCVRPSGDNMAAMVTHMSDQCKIMESLIIYCDWMCKSTGESPPCPAPADVHVDAMTTSFSDMTDLLRRVNRTDDDLEKTKDNIVRSILNVRRGSKKGAHSRSSEAPVKIRDNSSSSQQLLSCRKTVSDRPLNAETRSIVQQQKQGEAFIKETYQERNIDEEIENRCYEAQKNSIPEGTGDLGKEESRQTDLDLAVDEYRRQREEQIYSARRIFITGTTDNAVNGDKGSSFLKLRDTFGQFGGHDDPNNKKSDAENGSSSDKLDGLVRHTRHLNLSGCAEPALDVLSPETREKIRRLQVDGQLLKLKGQRQNVQLKKVESARQRVERAWERAKADAEQDDYLDAFANDPVHPDALSVTSDYSTTSSATGGDGLPPPSSTRSAMSHSCNGVLPLSDYSSTGSPFTPHLPQKLDPLNQSRASMDSAESEKFLSEQASNNAVYDRDHFINYLTLL